MSALGGLITAFLTPALTIAATKPTTRHGLERQQPLHGLFAQRSCRPGGSWRRHERRQRGAEAVWVLVVGVVMVGLLLKR